MLYHRKGHWARKIADRLGDIDTTCIMLASTKSAPTLRFCWIAMGECHDTVHSASHEARSSLQLLFFGCGRSGVLSYWACSPCTPVWAPEKAPRVWHTCPDGQTSLSPSRIAQWKPQSVTSEQLHSVRPWGKHRCLHPLLVFSPPKRRAFLSGVQPPRSHSK